MCSFESYADLREIRVSAYTSVPHRHFPRDPQQCLGWSFIFYVFLQFLLIFTFTLGLTILQFLLLATFFLFFKCCTHRSRTEDYRHQGRRICPSKRISWIFQSISSTQYTRIQPKWKYLHYFSPHLVPWHHERHELALKPFGHLLSCCSSPPAKDFLRWFKNTQHWWKIKPEGRMLGIKFVEWG